MPGSDGPAALRASGPIPNPVDWVGDRVADGVESLLRRVVESFVDDLAAPVARFVLHTPDLLGEPTLRRLWLVSLAVLFAVAGLLVAISATAMATGSTRTGLAAREAVSTRLAGSMLTAAVSLPLVALEVQLANRVVDAFVGEGFDAASNPLWKTLGKAALGDPGSSLALLISSVVAVVLLVALVVLGLARWATLWLLVVLAPIGMGFSLLPGGAGVARTWWRLQLAAVFLPIANAVLLATYLAMFSSESSGPGRRAVRHRRPGADVEAPRLGGERCDRRRRARHDLPRAPRPQHRPACRHRRQSRRRGRSRRRCGCRREERRERRVEAVGG